MNKIGLKAFSVKVLLVFFLVIVFLSVYAQKVHAETTATSASTHSAKNIFTKRYVFYRGNMNVPADLERLTKIMERAAAVGYNGIVLRDTSNWVYNKTAGNSQSYKDTIDSLITKAKSLGMVIIPDHFCQTYPSIEAKNSDDVVEAFPVRDTPFVVSSGSATVKANLDVEFPNGSFENWRINDQNAPVALRVDKPGTVAFRDDSIQQSGSSSIRIHDAGINGGYGRVCNDKLIPVEPYKAYQVSVWIKSEDIASWPKKSLKFVVYGYDTDGKAERVLYINDNYEGSLKKDWAKYTFTFNSLDKHEIRVYFGVWDSSRSLKGDIWFTNVKLQEVGLYNTVRRSNCPIIVKSQDGKTIYKETSDYIVKNGSLAIPAGSTIPLGAALKVSWYQKANVFYGDEAASACNKEFFDIFSNDARYLNNLFSNPSGIMISYDEWRIANWDNFDNNTSAGKYIADTMHKTETLIKKASPIAELYVWSDMFDPYHNAVDNYYAVNGSLKGSIEGVSKDTVIMNWNAQKTVDKESKEPKILSSLKFFANNGYHQVIAGYYEDLGNVGYWLDSLDQLESTGKLKNIDGFMYTTWHTGHDGGIGEYDDLEKVAQLITQRGRWENRPAPTPSP